MDDPTPMHISELSNDSLFSHWPSGSKLGHQQLIQVQVAHINSGRFLAFLSLLEQLQFDPEI